MCITGSKHLLLLMHSVDLYSCFEASKNFRLNKMWISSFQIEAQWSRKQVQEAESWHKGNITRARLATSWIHITWPPPPTHTKKWTKVSSKPQQTCEREHSNKDTSLKSAPFQIDKMNQRPPPPKWIDQICCHLVFISPKGHIQFFLKAITSWLLLGTSLGLTATQWKFQIPVTGGKCSTKVSRGSLASHLILSKYWPKSLWPSSRHLNGYQRA